MRSHFIATCYQHIYPQPFPPMFLKEFYMNLSKKLCVETTNRVICIAILLPFAESILWAYLDSIMGILEK